jgi:serine protease Do
VVAGSLFLGGLSGVGASYFFLKAFSVPAVSTTTDEVESFSYDENAMIKAQQAVAPAVVSIVEYVDLQELRGQYFGGSGVPASGETLKEVGGGTGFIIDPSGIVLTNKHVVSNEKGQYVALLNDGTEFEVTIEAVDPGNDIAIVRLSAEAGSEAEALLGQLPYAEFGDSSELLVGQQVLAIGNALAEYENTTTAGIISATGRKVVASDAAGRPESLYGLIQTDAAINLGNSGGPLINLQGEVIGLNTAVDTEAQGIGFAIPIDDVKPAIESWQTYGAILRPMLGVRYVMLTAPRAHDLGFDVDHGALIVGDPQTGELAVVEGSPADEAGLEEADVVLAVDGTEINLEYTLQDVVLHHQVGDIVTLTVWRDGATLELTVELTALPTSD